MQLCIGRGAPTSIFLYFLKISNFVKVGNIFFRIDVKVGDIGGGWWNGLYLDYFLLLTFGGIPWQVGMLMIDLIIMVSWLLFRFTSKECFQASRPARLS